MPTRFTGLAKKQAREWVARTFTQSTGYPRIADDRQFWELCWEQVGPTSSFHQFCDLGILQPHQYRGVDRSEDIVTKNRSFHGDRVQFICDTWDSAVRQSFSQLEFNPHLIYLDTESMAVEAARLAAYTMSYCPQDTVLVTNMVATNVRRGWVQKDVAEFTAALGAMVPTSTMRKWGDAKSIAYCGERGVKMLQFSMHKREL